MPGSNARLQNAVEFLMTYGWAILILIVVIATLYSLGIFNQGSVAPNLCALPANVGCVSAVLWPNGIVSVNIQQATAYTINIVGIGCNTQGIANAPAPSSGNAMLLIGGNATFSVQCWTVSGVTWTAYNAPIGQTYSGYIILNYTDIGTGFQHTVSGALIQKVK